MSAFTTEKKEFIGKEHLLQSPILDFRYSFVVAKACGVKAWRELDRELTSDNLR
jgi:hypothetical protein